MKKLAGVLGETIGLGTADPQAIVGIGVNADWHAVAFPQELADSMTSLRVLSGGRPIDRAALLEAFLGRFEARYVALSDGRGAPPPPPAIAATAGEVEAMHFGRPVQYGKFGYPDAMVLKMNTQKGESGGPLFDGSGRLVGMVVSTLTDAQGQPLRLAHAVPATSLAGFLCSNVACSPDWQALAGQSTGSCPKT